jgi:hypothetical protein
MHGHRENGVSVGRPETSFEAEGNQGHCHSCHTLLPGNKGDISIFFVFFTGPRSRRSSETTTALKYTVVSPALSHPFAGEVLRNVPTHLHLIRILPSFTTRSLIAVKSSGQDMSTSSFRAGGELDLRRIADTQEFKCHRNVALDGIITGRTPHSKVVRRKQKVRGLRRGRTDNTVRERARKTFSVPLSRSRERNSVRDRSRIFEKHFLLAREGIAGRDVLR